MVIKPVTFRQFGCTEFPLGSLATEMAKVDKAGSLLIPGRVGKAQQS